jgi:chemotaxis signal transduction protein
MPKLPTGPGDKILEQLRRARKSDLTQKTVESSQQYLTFRLGNEWYALMVSHLAEVLPLPKITRVPSVPAYLLGVINLRGEVLSVIDLKRFFEVPESTRTAEPIIVVIEHGEVRTGLLVEEIGDLIRLSPGGLTEEPLLLGKTQRAFFDGATRWGDVLVSIVNLDGLLQSEGLYSPG